MVVQVLTKTASRLVDITAEIPKSLSITEPDKMLEITHIERFRGQIYFVNAGKQKKDFYQ